MEDYSNYLSAQLISRVDNISLNSRKKKAFNCYIDFKKFLIKELILKKKNKIKCLSKTSRTSTGVNYKTSKQKMNNFYNSRSNQFFNSIPKNKTTSYLNTITEVIEANDLIEDNDEKNNLPKFFLNRSYFNINSKECSSSLNNESFDSCKTIDYETEDNHTRIFINKKGNYEVYYC